MSNNERIQLRIKRDKERRKKKREERYGKYDNFDEVFTIQHYITALKNCRKGVTWKRSVQNYEENAPYKIFKTLSSIKNGAVPKLKSKQEIILYERGKKRIITPIIIDDRMTQRVLCDNSLVPIITPHLIYDNGASMKGKGVNFARERMFNHILKARKEYGNNFYALVFDFSNYFGSIPHKTCRAVLNKYYHDERIADIIMQIIHSYHIADAEKIQDKQERKETIQTILNDEGVGICLGSQISQSMALVVPNLLDHHIKDKLRIKHYIRYMDDGVILHNDPKYLKQVLKEMIDICSELGLAFNLKKTNIVNISKGFRFLKVRYRISKKGKLVRTMAKSGIVRQRRKLKRFKRLVDKGEMSLDDVYNSMQSWVAHSHIANSYHARKNMIKLYNKLFQGHRIPNKWLKNKEVIA